MGGYFDLEKKQEQITILEKEINNPNFWTNPDKVKIETLNQLKKSLTSFNEIKNSYDLEYLEYLNDEEIKEIMINDYATIVTKLEKLEIEVLLQGQYDSNDAILEIHPGAGGTESCDWAYMLYRMFTRYTESKNYKYEILDYQKGEEAGLKSATILIKGTNAYGYLKNEKGVHRLVRISPFDSGARRHTSFASVEVTPYVDTSIIEVNINDQDLKIDVYRSSGAGGQSVNTTDSAVRITHLPTKTVVTCQNERSQIQNKEKAMEILKNKLYQIELEKQDQHLKSLKGEQISINFGSQIRSYVMHPYSMVKDHRTNIETSQVNKVLDGDLDVFINSCLKEI